MISCQLICPHCRYVAKAFVFIKVDGMYMTSHSDCFWGLVLNTCHCACWSMFKGNTWWNLVTLYGHVHSHYHVYKKNRVWLFPLTELLSASCTNLDIFGLGLPCSYSAGVRKEDSLCSLMVFHREEVTCAWVTDYTTHSNIYKQTTCT